jgi:hypothetical protein
MPGQPFTTERRYQPTVEKKMPISHSARLTLVSVCALCLFAWLTASASAAGLPKVENTGQKNINIVQTQMTANVNPNGARTNVWFKYRQVGESGWTLSPVQIVEGTSWVPVGVNLSLKPEATYELLVRATNLYGGTDGPIVEGFKSAAWSIESGRESSAVLGYGTMNLQWKAGGEQLKIECREATAGSSIGHPEATGDYYKPSGSECKFYINGTYRCESTPESFELNGQFVALVTKSYFHYCASEQNALISLDILGPFAVSMPHQAELLKTQPVTMTAPVQVLGWNGTLTFASQWELPSSLKFGVANL